MIWICFVILITYAGWMPFYRNPLYQDPSLNYYVGKKWIEGKIPGKDYAMGPGPILYVLYGAVGSVTKKNEVLFHFLSASFVAIGNVFLFLVTESVYGLVSALVACTLFAFYIFNPRLIGDRFPPEVYITTPCIGSLYFLVNSLQETTFVSPFMCGLMVSTGTLMRQGAYLYVPVLFTAIILGGSVYSAVFFLFGFSILHVLWIIYFAYNKACFEYIKKTMWNPVMLMVYANPEGKGAPRVDRMKVAGKRMIKLVVNNSLTILPLYMLAVSYIIYSVAYDGTIETVSVIILFGMSIALILPRKNFDCCYWLNSVPWACILAGNAISQIITESTFPYDVCESLTQVVLTLFLGHIVINDYPLYALRDPEKKDRLYDPNKINHASWWPTFNKIGRYVKENINRKGKVMVIGHAARIYNRSSRESFFYCPSFVPFSSKEANAKEYKLFIESIKMDYPAVIVLAGHMPAFPFNPKPYLEDMEEIQKESGIVYEVKKVMDGFPIYFANPERSYMNALLHGEFRNERLHREKEEVSNLTRSFEKDLDNLAPEQAVIRFIEGLQSEQRLEDAIYVIGQACSGTRFRFSRAQSAKLYILLGECQYQIGQIEAAKETFREVLKVMPGSCEAFNNLGVIYFSEGKIRESYEMFRMVLKQEPSHEEARENIRLIEAQDTKVAKNSDFQSNPESPSRTVHPQLGFES